MKKKHYESFEMRMGELCRMASKHKLKLDSTFSPVKQSAKKTEKFFKKTGNKLPAKLVKLFNEFGTIRISYVYFSEKLKRPIFGVSSMFGIDSMLQHPDPEITQKPKHGNALWTQGDDPELIAKLKEYFIFVDRYFDDYILIRIDENSDEPEIYLYTRPHILARLNLTIEQYFEIDLKVAGMYLWQQYFTSKEDLPYLRPDNLYENMAELFPEIDMSDFPKPDRPYLSYNLNVKSDIDYRSKITTLENELKSNDTIKVNEFNFTAYVKYSTHPSDLYRTFLALGYALPDSLLTFYQFVTRLDISWESTNSELTECKANARLLSVEDIYCGESRPGEWALWRKWGVSASEYYEKKHRDFDAPIMEELKQWHVLYRSEGSDMLIKFYPDKEPDLIYFDGTLHPIKATFLELIDTLITLKAINFFASVLTDDITTAKKVIKNFRMVFPDSPVPDRFQHLIED
jgi:hypothetical protein